MCLREEWQASKCLLKETNCSILGKGRMAESNVPLFLVLDATDVVKDVVNTFVLVCIPADSLIILVTLQSLQGMVEVFGWAVSPLSCICSQVAVNDASPPQQLIPIYLIGVIGYFLRWFFSNQPFCHGIKLSFCEPNLCNIILSSNLK